MDLQKTLDLLRGGLLTRRETWERWLAENPTIQQSAMLLAGPLIVGYAVLVPLFSRLMDTGLPSMLRPSLPVDILQHLLQGALGFAVITVVTAFLAGRMGGRCDYPRAFAAVSIVSVPGVVGAIVGALLPWLGGLLAFVAAIVSLVFLYQIQPLANEVPEDSRAKHFGVSLLGIFVINIVLAMLLFGGQSPRGLGDWEQGRNGGVSGPMNDFERQARLFEAAEADRFQPPGDGKVSEQQVERVIAVLERSGALVKERTEELEAAGKALSEKESVSLSDLGALFGSVGRTVSAMNTEMEVVKTGGGNWAEHQWVKEQLRVARIQQSGTAAIEHNYQLYQRFSEQLGSL
jgi:hypothetical protein